MNKRADFKLKNLFLIFVLLFSIVGVVSAFSVVDAGIMKTSIPAIIDVGLTKGSLAVLDVGIFGSSLNFFKDLSITGLFSLVDPILECKNVTEENCSEVLVEKVVENCVEENGSRLPTANLSNEGCFNETVNVSETVCENVTREVCSEVIPVIENESLTVNSTTLSTVGESENVNGMSVMGDFSIQSVSYTDAVVALSMDTADGVYNNTFAEDLSGKGNNGIVSGPIYDPIYKQYTYDGSNTNYLNVGNDASVQGNTFTIFVRAKFDASRTNQYVAYATKGPSVAGSGADWDLHRTSSNVVRLKLAGTRHSTAPITDNHEWHDVAVTYDGTTNSDGVKIYFNGILNASSQQTNTNIPANHEIGVGGPTVSYPYHMNGNIAKFLLFDYVLTPQEIANLSADLASQSNEPLSVTLNEPLDNFAFNLSDNVNFNFTVTGTNLSVCSLYGDWNGGWHENQSKSVVSGNESFSINNFNKINEFNWNVKCNETNSDEAWATSNYSFSIVNPRVVLNSTSGNNLSSDNLTAWPMGLNWSGVWTNYIYDWYKNGVLNLSGNGSSYSVIDSSLTSLNEVWSVNVTPFNSTAIGTSVLSNNITILEKLGVELNLPANDSSFATGDDITFVSTPSGTNLDTCLLYGDWNGGWHKNYTFSNIAIIKSSNESSNSYNGATVDYMINGQGLSNPDDPFNSVHTANWQDGWYGSESTLHNGYKGHLHTRLWLEDISSINQLLFWPFLYQANTRQPKDINFTFYDINGNILHSEIITVASQFAGTDSILQVFNFSQTINNVYSINLQVESKFTDSATETFTGIGEIMFVSNYDLGGKMIHTVKNFTELGNHSWNVKCNDTSSSEAWAVSNYSFSVVNPRVVLNSTSGNNFTTDNLTTYLFDLNFSGEWSGYTYDWYKNGVLNYTVNDSNILDSLFTTSGEVWQVNVTPYNSTTTGTTVMSNNITIQSAGINVTDIVPAKNSTYNVSDAIEVGANVTADLEVDFVYVNITLPNSTVIQKTLSNLSTWYNTSYVIANVAGQYNVIFVANDSSGNINSTETTFFVSEDYVAPYLYDFKPYSNSTYNETKTVNTTIEISVNVTDNFKIDSVWANVTMPNGTVTEVNFANISVLVGNSNDKFNVSYFVPLVVGRYNISYFANDSSGNVNSSVTSFFVGGDGTAPIMYDFKPYSNSTYNVSSAIELSVNVTDNVEIDSVWANVTMPNGTVGIYSFSNVTVLNNNVSDKYNVSYLVANLTGRYNISYYANDSSGNINSSVTSFFIAEDLVNPSIYDIVPAENSTYNVSDTIEIGANVTDNILVDSVYANITLPNSTIIQKTLSNLSTWYNTSYVIANVAGQYNVTFIANDSSGNINSTETTFFVGQDLVAPNISFLSSTTASGNYSQNYIMVNVTAADNVEVDTITVYLYNSSGVQQSNLTNSSFYWNITNLIDGIYYLNATVNDSSGNSNSTETRMIYLDTTAPYLRIISPVNTTYSNATQLLNISSNGENIWYNWNAINSTYTSTLDIEFNEGVNTIYAWANDSFGNLNSTLVAFTIDSISPIINFVNGTEIEGVNLTRNNIQINVTATNTALSNITINLYNSTGLVNSTLFDAGNMSTYNAFANITGLLDGVYSFNATTYDIAGNSNSTSTRTLTIDTTAPVILNVENTSTTSSSVIIVWNTTELSNSSINYGNTTSLGTALQNSSLVFDHSISLSNLGQNTTYYYNVTSCDVLGNCNTTGFYNFTTLEESFYDVELSQPANKTIANGTSAIYNITLTNTGNVVDNFTLSFTNPNNLESASLNTSLITNLSSGETSVFTLTVLDSEEGNYTNIVTTTSVSNSSVNYSISITTVIRNTISISSTSISPHVIINGSDVSLNISALNAESVWAKIEKPDLNSENLSLTNNVGVNFTNTILTGRYNVTFYANDSFGNIRISEDYFETAESLTTTINISVESSLSANDTDFIFKLIHPDSEDVIYETGTNGSFSISVPDIKYNILFLDTFNGTMNLTLEKVNLSANLNSTIKLDKHNVISGYLVTYGIKTDYLFNISEVKFSYAGEGYTNEDNLQLWKCSNYDFNTRSCISSDADVTGSAIQNKTTHYFIYNTTSFSGFSIKQYIAPTTTTTTDSGGGGGGLCSDGYEKIDGKCVLIPVSTTENNPDIPENETDNPKKLFDIRMDLEDTTIDFSNKLQSVITFASFGRVPTFVNLTHRIYDISGNLVYEEFGNITVTTEQILRKSFPNLNLPDGTYTYTFSSLYNVDVYDEYSQEFTVGKKGLVIPMWLWYVIGGVILIGLLVGFRKKIFRNKKVVKKRKIGRVLKKSFHQTGKTDIGRDQKSKALAPGKRVSRRGKIYYENRANRSDQDGKMSISKKILGVMRKKVSIKKKKTLEKLKRQRRNNEIQEKRFRTMRKNKRAKEIESLGRKKKYKKDNRVYYAFKKKLDEIKEKSRKKKNT